MLVVRMQEKGRLYSSLSLLREVQRFIFIIAFLLLYEESFRSIIMAEVGCILTHSFLVYYFVKAFWSGSKRFNKGIVKEMFCYGAPFVPTLMLMWVFNSMDKIALRAWADFSEIGIYSAGFKLVAALTIIRTAFSLFWGPTAYRWYESATDVRKFNKVGLSLLGIMISLAAIIILLRNAIILMLSPQYLHAAVLVPFLIYIPVMHTLGQTTAIGINFLKKTYYHIITAGCAALANFGGNILLVPKYGALGAAISTSLSYILFFWIRTLISRRLWHRFPINKYIVNNALLVTLSFSTLFLRSGFYEAGVLVGVFLYNYSTFKYLFAVLISSNDFLRFKLPIRLNKVFSTKM